MEHGAGQEKEVVNVLEFHVIWPTTSKAEQHYKENFYDLVRFYGLLILLK